MLSLIGLELKTWQLGVQHYLAAGSEKNRKDTIYKMVEIQAASLAE